MSYLNSSIFSATTRQPRPDEYIQVTEGYHLGTGYGWSWTAKDLPLYEIEFTYVPELNYDYVASCHPDTFQWLKRNSGRNSVVEALIEVKAQVRDMPKTTMRMNYAHLAPAGAAPEQATTALEELLIGEIKSLIQTASTEQPGNTNVVVKRYARVRSQIDAVHEALAQAESLMEVLDDVMQTKLKG